MTTISNNKLDKNFKLKNIFSNFKTKLSMDNNNYQNLKNLNQNNLLTIVSIFTNNNEIIYISKLKKKYVNENLDNILNKLINENNYLINNSLKKIFFFKFLINISNIDILLDLQNKNIDYSNTFKISFIDFFIDKNKIISKNSEHILNYNNFNKSDFSDESKYESKYETTNKSTNDLFFIEDLNTLYLIFEKKSETIFIQHPKKFKYSYYKTKKIQKLLQKIKLVKIYLYDIIFKK